MDDPHRDAAARERRAARYHRLQLGLGAARLAVGVIYLVAMLGLGAGHVVAAVAGRMSEAWWFEVAAIAIALGLGHAIVTFPLACVRGWLLPRRFGLLHQPFGAWLADQMKAAALGGGLALIVLWAIYALMRATALWWLWAAGFTTLLGLVTATLFPVLVVPLFYRTAPLADDALRRRLLDLASRLGVPAMDVVVVDQSRKSRTANAGLTGFGRTRRIILFDTLVQQFPEDEIEAVLAHELGHHVHRDLRLGLAMQAAASLLIFGLADRLLRASAELAGLGHLADPTGLPWVILVLGGLGLVTVPLVNSASRRREYRADAFAARATGKPAVVAAALDRLGRLNLAERQPSRLEEALLHSHPSIARRIAALGTQTPPRVLQ